MQLKVEKLLSKVYRQNYADRRQWTMMLKERLLLSAVMPWLLDSRPVHFLPIYWEVAPLAVAIRLQSDCA